MTEDLDFTPSHRGTAVGDERRCTAMSKRSHERCKRFRTPGRSVCKFHGGYSPRGFAHPSLTHGWRSADVLAQMMTEATVSDLGRETSVTPWTKHDPMEGDAQ